MDLVYEDPLAVNKTIRGPHPQTVVMTHQLFRDPHKQTLLIRYFRVYGRSIGVYTASAGPRALSRIPTPGVGVGVGGARGGGDRTQKRAERSQKNPESRKTPKP